mgnify:CR=1 FL=1
MKKIITMVGTSLFENYLEKKDDTNFIKAYNYFKNNKIKAEGLDNELNRRKYIEKSLNEKYFKNNPNASAEIKSLLKLKKELDDKLEIHLLYSDTALSRLAAEILQNSLSYYDELNDCTINQPKKIVGLQIWDRNEFNKGMVNLINTIYKISQGYWENIIINITGGYKANVPYLTILGQINKCEIYYIFEDTDALIKIPYAPIDINWRVFEENETFFMELEMKGVKELSQGLTLKNDVLSLLEFAGNLYCLNPLGVALWEKYKEKFNLLYISPIVSKYIEENRDRKDIKDIIEKSFNELKRRLYTNPQHPDLDHRISGFHPEEGFKIFKHKEDNLQVRILYKPSKWTTTYGKEEYTIYIGLIAIGSEVHNVESEYVEKFRQEVEKVNNLENYQIYKTYKKEGSYV